MLNLIKTTIVFLLAWVAISASAFLLKPSFQSTINNLFPQKGGTHVRPLRTLSEIKRNSYTAADIISHYFEYSDRDMMLKSKKTQLIIMRDYPYQNNQFQRLISEIYPNREIISALDQDTQLIKHYFSSLDKIISEKNFKATWCDNYQTVESILKDSDIFKILAGRGIDNRLFKITICRGLKDLETHCVLMKFSFEHGGKKLQGLLLSYFIEKPFSTRNDRNKYTAVIVPFLISPVQTES